MRAHVEPASQQLHNQHAVPKHVKLVSTTFENLGVATHNKLFPSKGCRQHDMARPRLVEVRQQHVHQLEVESGVYVEVGPPRLRLDGSFGLQLGGRRLEGPHDGRAHGDDTPPPGHGPVDLCGRPVPNLEVLGPDLVVLNLLLGDVADRKGLGRPDMQRDVGDLDPLGDGLGQQRLGEVKPS